MRKGAVAFVAAIVAISAGVTRARAQTASDAPVAIPAGYEHFEVSDLTFTMRDDGFSTITADPVDPHTAYVGTYQGRFYKTTDGGRTWDESTIIPEQKNLWQAQSTIFFGAIRDPGGSPSAVSLRDEGPLLALRAPTGIGRPGVAAAPDNWLENESYLSAGGGQFFLGVGLSSRSPRLSILTGSRGRPVPTLNRQRLLIEHTLRGTDINRLAVDPDDRRLLYATTPNGLYKSDDGGVSWSRIFAGMTAAERLALIVAIRPQEPKLMILGTASGAYTSVDKGVNWSKITTVGGAVNEVAFDTEDSNFIYLATNGGVLRSSDSGQSFLPIYFSTFPAEQDVRSIVIDPFDPNTAYIGTMRGTFVSHSIRTTKTMGDWQPLGGVQGILAVPRVAVCAHHRGHLYALTRGELWTINYGADPPESAILESWDAGRTWRQLFVGQTGGAAESLDIDSKDPDQMWIVWSKGVHRLERGASNRPARSAQPVDDRIPLGPPIGEIVGAALKYHDLELDDYVKKIAHSKARSLVPRTFKIIGRVDHASWGSRQDDNQFAAGRYLQVMDRTQWAVMALASWDFGASVYSADAVPMLRYRVSVLNDELRGRILESLSRSYGELLKIRSCLAASQLNLATRVTYRLRIEQLEAIVDLTSGGYLSRWRKQHRRTDK